MKHMCIVGLQGRSTVTELISLLPSCFHSQFYLMIVLLVDRNTQK